MVREISCFILVLLFFLFGGLWITVFIRSYLLGREVGTSGFSVSKDRRPLLTNLILIKRIIEGILVIIVGIVFLVKLC